MNYKITFILIFMSLLSFSQEKNLALQKSNDLVYEGNILVSEDFISAEKEYRKAISKAPTNAIGSYNLGNGLYRAGHLDEAMAKHLETIKNATSKTEKHKAFHNIGNVLMGQKLCKEAVEVYKNALRNNPKDDETRYNLALAKECAKEQGDGEGEDEDNKDDDEKKDENKENEDEKDEGDDKNDEQDNEGEDKEDKKDGDEKEDENGKPKDEKDNKDNKKPGDKKKQQQQAQPGKLSPQQVKNLLEAMNNHEKKVQDKINAKKTKGVKVRTEKDW